MSSKARFFSIQKLWLTPAEIIVLSLAAGVIWLAKWQDGLLIEHGYSQLAQTRHHWAQSSAVSANIFTTKIKDVEMTGVPAPPPNPQIMVTGVHRTEELNKFLRKYKHYQQLRYQSPKLKKEEWESLSKNATVNFGFVEEIFSNTSRQTGTELTVREILNDPLLAAKVFRQFEMRFGISIQDSERFAREPLASELSEWAFFIENRM